MKYALAIILGIQNYIKIGLFKDVWKCMGAFSIIIFHHNLGKICAVIINVLAHFICLTHSELIAMRENHTPLKKIHIY